MKVAIVSDVHGNLAALETVLAEARSLGAGDVWSLGDAVGYGPRPKECLQLLAGAASLQIMGNHDAAVAELTPVVYFTENARAAVEWTRNVLAEADVAALTRLPYTACSGGCLLVHGSPDDPPAWRYITGPSRAQVQFECYAEQVCFVGHTHVPFIADDQGEEVLPSAAGGKVFLKGQRRYLVNAGSVGQPRDRDPRASWALFDPDERSVEILRTPYDVGKTQSLMREYGLPPFLVERLSQGI